MAESFSVDSSMMDEDSTDSSESSFSSMKSPSKRPVTRRNVMTRQSSFRRPGLRSRRYSQSQMSNLLYKLHLRQMFGKIQARANIYLKVQEKNSHLEKKSVKIVLLRTPIFYP